MTTTITGGATVTVPVEPTNEQIQAAMLAAIKEVRATVTDATEGACMDADISRMERGLVDIGDTGWAVMRSFQRLAAAPALTAREEAPAEVAGRLLRPSGSKPPRCYCPPDRCDAPVIMGRQTPCIRARSAPVEAVANPLSGAFTTVKSVGSLTPELREATIRMHFQGPEAAERAQAALSYLERLHEAALYTHPQPALTPGVGGRVVGTIAHVSNGRSELPELIAAALTATQPDRGVEGEDDVEDTIWPESPLATALFKHVQSEFSLRDDEAAEVAGEIISILVKHGVDPTTLPPIIAKPADGGLRDERLKWFLRFVEASGGQIDSTEYRGNPVAMFCDDRGTSTDTFNLSEGLGYTKTGHDTSHDTSVTRLTEAGLAALAAGESAK